MRRHTVFVAAALVAAAAAGCAAASDGSATPAPVPAGGVVDPDDIADERLGPLLGLGACPSQTPAPTDVEVPDGMPLPEAAVVAQVTPAGPLTSLQGWAPRTPVEIMVGYLRTDGWEVEQAEDEVFESEVLLTRGAQRLYVKAQAVCERASAWVAFLGENDAPVPTPSGAAP